MTANTNTINRNASASLFGWDFQTNAAILLMLQNIQKADSVKVESSTEDIEIKLCDGNIIYSQAKSIMNADDTANLSKKLKDAIKTLNDANNNGNVEKLIYISPIIQTLLVIEQQLVILVQQQNCLIMNYLRNAGIKLLKLYLIITIT